MRHAVGLLVPCAVATAVALGASCERIGYYSVTGSAGAGDGPSGPSVGSGTGAVTRGMVLENVATCGSQMYGSFAAAAAELESATAAYEASPSDATRAGAQQAWSNAVALWQQAEIIKVGAAGPTTLPSGQGLRDYVYSWPLVSRCLVEQNLVSKAYEKSSFSLTALLNTRGLYAAEYLLFYDGADNDCPSSSSINSQGTWAALGAPEIAARKRSYAAVVARDVAAKAGEIQGVWVGEFGEELAASGSAKGAFPTDQKALNAVSDGLFYVEREVKDMKLGRPLGKLECPNASCPELVESLYAKVSRDHVKNNLIGFRTIFAGCEGASDAGFDDLLRSVGASDLADRMAADTDAAIAYAESLESADFGALLASDKAALEGLHAAVKRVSDSLKTDFITVLDLEPPKIVEGDND